MQSIERYLFPKSARLSGLKAVSALFAAGRWGSASPLKYIVAVCDDVDSCEQPAESASVEKERRVKVLVSVPKKLFRRANRRNLLKRRIREAYRLNCNDLERYAEQNNLQISLGLMYSSAEIAEYKEIENAVKRVISTIQSSR